MDWFLYDRNLRHERRFLMKNVYERCCGFFIADFEKVFAHGVCLL